MTQGFTRRGYPSVCRELPMQPPIEQYCNRLISPTVTLEPTSVELLRSTPSTVSLLPPPPPPHLLMLNHLAMWISLCSTSKKVLDLFMCIYSMNIM